MSLSDDQERCEICKYHGCCPVDANGYTPCEKDYEKKDDDDGQEDLDHVKYIKQADKKDAVNEFLKDYYAYGCWGEIWDESNIKYVVGVCNECGCPVDENGEALIGCSYSPVHCIACGFRRCDQSC